jgi:single-strand DNA-binding protein
MTVTIVGNVIDDVVKKPMSNGGTRLQFRLAANRRRKNAEGQWEDWRTLYINVVCWRDLAENAGDSIKRGDPVVVRGDLVSRQYVKDEVTRTVYEIEADAVSHDYSRGTSTGFTRRKRGSIGAIETDANGLPAIVPFDDDDSDLPPTADDLAYVLVDEYGREGHSAERPLVREFATTG